MHMNHLNCTLMFISDVRSGYDNLVTAFTSAMPTTSGDEEKASDIWSSVN